MHLFSVPDRNYFRNRRKMVFCQNRKKLESFLIILQPDNSNISIYTDIAWQCLIKAIKPFKIAEQVKLQEISI